MGTVDSFLCDRLGAGFATEPATASRTQLQRIDRPGLRRAPLRDLRRPDGRPARGPRHGGRARDAAARELAGRAAVPRPGGRPAGGAGRRGLRRARPRQGDLRHRRLRPRPRRRGGARSPPAACCRRSPGASTARSSTRSTAASSRRGRCSSGCATSSASPRDPPALSKLAREAETSAGAQGAARAWPGSGRPGGGPTPAP